MAETTVENRICRHCEVEVRPNTLFCYNCGKSVAPELVEDLPSKKDVGDGRFRENAVEIKEKKNSDGRKPPIAVREATEQPILKPAVAVAEPELKSAAAMRRRKKNFQPKRVEIIWEEHKNAPNGWFIIAAILLTLFAAGILYLAMSLK